MMHTIVFMTWSFVLLFAQVSLGAVTTYTNFSQWQQVAGEHHSVTFIEYSPGMVMTNQYSHLGITFTDGNDFIYFTQSFPTDNYGLMGGFGAPAGIRMVFDAPIHSIGVHFAGNVQYQLYSGGSLFYTSGQFGFQSSFAGIFSTVDFDEVRLIDPVDNAIYIDNVYFNVPGPSVLGMFGLAGLVLASRRKRSHDDVHLPG